MGPKEMGRKRRRRRKGGGGGGGPGVEGPRGEGKREHDGGCNTTGQRRVTEAENRNHGVVHEQDNRTGFQVCSDTGHARPTNLLPDHHPAMSQPESPPPAPPLGRGGPRGAEERRKGQRAPPGGRLTGRAPQGKIRSAETHLALLRRSQTPRRRGTLAPEAAAAQTVERPVDAPLL